MGAPQEQKTTMSSDQSNFAMRGTLEGHSNWVTAIATTNENPEMILSASRDKTVMVWKLTREDGSYGYPQKALRGHGHFVQDVVISSDGQFALSGSWDGTLRLWDLNTGLTTRRFVGHDKDVLSVAFSADNRQIVSGSRDKTIKLWNTLGECKYTIQSEGEGHSEWVSCVSFSPDASHPLIVCGSCPTASFALTSSVTPATSTLSPSPLTAPCAPLAARTVLPCCGTSTRASASTRSPASSVTSSTPCASPPTATGCALPPITASASGTSRARASWMSSSSSSPWPTPSPRLSLPRASRSPGPPTATPCSLATPTARSACGRSPLARPPSTKVRVRACVAPLQ